MNRYSTVDGEKFHYLIQQSYTHLPIVIRCEKMIYDKGCLFVYGIMNGVPYAGLITYYRKTGSIGLRTITGDGLSYEYGGLESNNTIIRIVLGVRTYSVYTIQGIDPFEFAYTNG